MALFVNFVGPPSSGKSTAAKAVFAELRRRGVEVEFSGEFAKELSLQKRFQELSCQPYVFGAQLARHLSCAAAAEVVVTDGALMLCSIYGRMSDEAERGCPVEVYPESFFKFIDDQYVAMGGSHWNFRRVFPYARAGRNQDEAFSDAIGTKVTAELDRLGVDYVDVRGDDTAVPLIVEDTIARLARAKAAA